MSSEIKRALYELKELRKECRKGVGSTRLLINKHIELANLYKYEYSYKEAINHFKFALTIRLKDYSSDSVEIAKLNTTIANIYEIKHTYKYALHHYKKALSEYISIDKESLEALNIYHSMATIYHEVCNYTEGLNVINKALDIAHKHFYSDSVEIAELRAVKGLFYYYKREYKSALEYLISSLQIQLQHKDFQDKELKGICSFIKEYMIDNSNVDTSILDKPMIEAINRVLSYDDTILDY